MKDPEPPDNNAVDLLRILRGRRASFFRPLVAREFLFELLDAKEQLVDCSVRAHQTGVHRGSGLELLLDAVPAPDVLDRNRCLLREGLQLLEVTGGDWIEGVR